MRTAIHFAARQVRARPLACFTAAFLIGALIQRDFSIPALWCAPALLAALGAIFIARRQRLVAAFLLLAVGALCGMTRMALVPGDAQPAEDRYSVKMEGRVASEPYLNPQSGRLIFRFRLERADDAAETGVLRLYLRGEEALLREIAYGQRLSLTGHIWAADPATNPYEFDFRDYLNRHGFNGYATAKIEDVEILGASADLQTVVIAARQAISRRIDALFIDNAGLMRALVLGDRSMLSDELRAALNRSGIAHLVSISGMHVTLLAAMLSLVLGRFMPMWKARLASVALLIPYGALIGFGAPFVRALMMFALMCFAPVAGRPGDAVTRLCAALLAFLLVEPRLVADAGFALSFSASAGIILLLPPISNLLGLDALRDRKSSSRRLARLTHSTALYFGMLLCASLAAQLATLPAVIAFFGAQSVVSLPFNLVCVPLCMAAYVLGMAVLLVSVPFMPLAALIARVPDGMFSLLTAITRFSAKLPVSSVHIGRYPSALVLAHWGILLSASDLSRLRPRWRHCAPIALIAVAGLSALLCLGRAWGFSVVFLDAGQADSAVVRTRGHTYLIDVGDTYTPAADYLNATCLSLDGIVLSHPHQDHAGGLEQVLTSFRPRAIYVPSGWFDVEEVSPSITAGMALAREMGVEIVELSTGDSVPLSPVARMDVYAPEAGCSTEEPNDMSLLTLVSCEGKRALFTGDLSAEAEPEVIPDTDILKVPHHGSNKAGSQRLLDACTPEIAVISVGENNYGHPGEETLKKLKATGARVYLTRECGAITVSWRGGAWRVEPFLEDGHEVE